MAKSNFHFKKTGNNQSNAVLLPSRLTSLKFSIFLQCLFDLFSDLVLGGLRHVLDEEVCKVPLPPQQVLIRPALTHPTILDHDYLVTLGQKCHAVGHKNPESIPYPDNLFSWEETPLEVLFILKRKIKLLQNEKRESQPHYAYLQGNAVRYELVFLYAKTF